MNLKKLLAIVLALVLVMSLFAACGDGADRPGASDKSKDFIQDDRPEDGTGSDEADTVRIASLKGPTTIGMVKLMDDSDNGLASINYDVQMFGTADEIVGLLVSGNIDIANVPCNLASVLYKRTDGGIKVLDINTLGVLYIIESGEAISSVSDLKGKTVYSTGKGTTPEYVLNYILQSNGIDPVNDVTIEYKSEATEVAAMLAQSADAIAVLPQPYVTVAMNQNESLRIALDLTEEWNKIDGTQLVTGVTVVRTEFLTENPNTVAQFMSDYAASVEYVNSNIDEAAALVGKYDIVAEAVAKKAIPYCNIVLEVGDEMVSDIKNYLTVLYNSDPTSVGGEIPDDNFYYLED